MAGLPEVFCEVVTNGFVFQILMRDLSDSRICLSIISRALSATTIMYSTYNSCRRFLSQRCLKQHQSNTARLTSELGVHYRKKRTADIEPVFANIKHNKTLNDLCLKGLIKQKLRLVCWLQRTTWLNWQPDSSPRIFSYQSLLKIPLQPSKNEKAASLLLRRLPLFCHIASEKFILRCLFIGKYFYNSLQTCTHVNEELL